MPEKFACPSCGHVIDEDELAKVVRFDCPKCGEKAFVRTDDRDLIAQKDGGCWTRKSEGPQIWPRRITNSYRTPSTLSMLAYRSTSC